LSATAPPESSPTLAPFPARLSPTRHAKPAPDAVGYAITGANKPAIRKADTAQHRKHPGRFVGEYKEITMILIADDDVDFAENCSMMLESHGYDVSVALSGSEALASISGQQPDLLISDCCMPDLSGVELSEQIKAGPLSGRFPVLLMSGSLQCRVASGTSYDGFLRKPFLAEDLLIEVRKLLQKSATTKNEYEGTE
jgi:two-component system chemotaxis response regulator CheY